MEIEIEFMTFELVGFLYVKRQYVTANLDAAQKFQIMFNAKIFFYENYWYILI